MSNMIKAYVSTDRPTGGEREITATVSGNKAALDVNIANASDINVNIDIDSAGLATAAKQDTGNTSLASVDTKLTALSSIDTKLTSQATASNQSTANTALAAIQAALAQQNPKGMITNNYASVNVGAAAYVQLSAALPANIRSIETFDSGGQPMILAIGGAGVEVDTLLVPPGGNLPPVQWSTLSGQRLSIKCATPATTVSAGLLVINLFG